MTTNFNDNDLSAPARGVVSVTPSDTVDLTIPSRYLYVGSAGDVKVDMVDGTITIFTSVAAGTILPIRVSRVYLTLTTASGIIALY